MPILSGDVPSRSLTKVFKIKEGMNDKIAEIVLRIMIITQLHNPVARKIELVKDLCPFASVLSFSHIDINFEYNKLGLIYSGFLPRSFKVNGRFLPILKTSSINDILDKRYRTKRIRQTRKEIGVIIITFLSTLQITHASTGYYRRRISQVGSDLIGLGIHDIGGK